jgi:hypothetical protein
MNRTTVISVLIVVLALAAGGRGGDCPRFRGPAGDGQFPETGLLKQWPEGGPKLAWTAQSGNKGLVCLEWKTGKPMWNAPTVGMGVVIAADGMLYVYGQDGKMSLVRPNPAAFEPVSQFAVSEGTNEHWAHPTIAHGRLYIRHGDVLLAYDIKG